MTHQYIPNTEADRAAMLKTIGVASVDDLFYDVPASARHPKINLPRALSELELSREIAIMAGRDANLVENACFLGAGAYNHFIPATVPHLIFRSEFYTAYTPYQAEISQGTLQTIFEYQSMICDLTGMDAANASHYDGATAAAEAAILAINQLHGRDKVLVCPTLHPEYRATLRTYLSGQGVEIVGDGDTSKTFEEMLDKHLDDKTACVIVGNPDFLGHMRDLKPAADRVHAAGALFIVSAYPISLGLYKPPAEYGADVVVGEGQSLGNPVAFGGPYLGIFATKEKYLRRMAGRLVGQTDDTKGRRGFVLTLQAREQHIRR
ncbi:MAG: aminomethyl-transferring glycine dehydrogenase subunit GcvPA, partial [Chloroflexota bacterium]|nr:aminomethyl-transferring glycine dehydrogenase subunit GcvPA [Chloroflexota bacterium]